MRKFQKINNLTILLLRLQKRISLEARPAHKHIERTQVLRMRDIWRKIPPLIRHGIFLLGKKFHLMEKNASHFFVYRLATCGKYLTYGFCKTDTRRNNEDDDYRQFKSSTARNI